MTTLSTQHLIIENNRKRKLLTAENEAYYLDLLVYIRMQWRLSEKQSEEILMEMLDHLLDAQAENKTAQEVFGENPLQFADELMNEIATEKPRNMLLFLAGVFFHLLGIFLVIRAGLLTIFSEFMEVKLEVNIFHVSVVSIIIAGFVIFNIWFILRTVKQDLFRINRQKEWKKMMKVGSAAAISMIFVLLMVNFTPQIGFSFTFGPLPSFITGATILIFYYTLKKVKHS